VLWLTFFAFNKCIWHANNCKLLLWLHLIRTMKQLTSIKNGWGGGQTKNSNTNIELRFT
jgi:hypothetical protein